MVSTTLVLVGLAATGLLLLCSAFFSSSETAVFSLSPAWIDEQAASKSPGAATLKELRGDPHRLLVTLLVGNNVVNIAITSILTVVIATYLPAGPTVAVTTVATSFLILIFGEIVPKAYGLANAERWSLTIAPPVRLVERALAPLIFLFDGITRRMNSLISVDPDIEKPYTD